MWKASILLLPGLVFVANGDSCVSFCSFFWGSCTGSTVCTPDGVCRSMFWHDESKKGVCHTSKSLKKCHIQYPVTCDDARIFVKHKNHLERKYEGGSSDIVDENAGIPYRSAQGNLKKQFSQGRTTSWELSHIDSARLVLLELNTPKNDQRPGIRLFFPESEQEFVLMFDTGSDASLIQMGSEGFHGYAIDQAASFNVRAGSFCYGVPGKCLRAIPTVGNMKVPVRISSANPRVSFEQEILFQVMARPDDGPFPVGLLGASPTSVLANLLGYFTYIPSRGRAGSIMWGGLTREQWEKVCEGPPVTVELLDEFDYQYWLVSGTNSYNGIRTPEAFVLDTGAQGVMLSKRVFGAVLERIQEIIGSDHSIDTTKRFPVLDAGCGESVLFPEISFTVDGIDTLAQLTVKLGPDDYVRNLPNGRCKLMITDESLASKDQGKLLGIHWLNKFVVGFNAKEKKMDICKLATAVPANVLAPRSLNQNIPDKHA